MTLAVTTCVSTLPTKEKIIISHMSFNLTLPFVLSMKEQIIGVVVKLKLDMRSESRTLYNMLVVYG